MSWAEGSPVYPSYPGRANFSYILLQNVAKRLHENQKVGLARVTRHLAVSPFCDGRQGHPPTWANFSTLFFFFFFSYLGYVCLFVCLPNRTCLLSSNPLLGAVDILSLLTPLSVQRERALRDT